jgi:hypothetical protein
MGDICSIEQAAIYNRAPVKIAIPPFVKENMQVVVK